MYISLLIAACSILSAGESEKKESRTWTSTSGQEVEAVLEKEVAGYAYLKKDDGKVIRIQVSRLSDDDQKFINDSKPKQAKKRAIGTLSDEEVAALKTQWTDEDSGKSYTFYGSFDYPKLSDSDKRKYSKSEKIPIRITTTLYEIKEVRGKKQSMRMNGNCEFYVINEETGDMVFKKKVSLAKMCPS